MAVAGGCRERAAGRAERGRRPRIPPPPRLTCGNADIPPRGMTAFPCLRLHCSCQFVPRRRSGEGGRRVVSHGFHPQHTQRLAAYWSGALGGPACYSDTHGDESSVVRMHSGNGPHEEMDRRAVDCFDQALADVGLAVSEPVGKVLHEYFLWATTTTMARYHESADDVPEGLVIPRWSWDGLQT